MCLADTADGLYCDRCKRRWAIHETVSSKTGGRDPMVQFSCPDCGDLMHEEPIMHDDQEMMTT